MANFTLQLFQIISTIVMVEVIDIWNREDCVFFRVTGGYPFGYKQEDPKRGVFAHTAARKSIPYLKWNGDFDFYDEGGCGDCGKLMVLYSENYAPPEASMKVDDSPIDKGEVVAKDYEVLWLSPRLWYTQGSITSEVSASKSIDWGALLRE